MKKTILLLMITVILRPVIGRCGATNAVDWKKYFEWSYVSPNVTDTTSDITCYWRAMGKGGCRLGLKCKMQFATVDEECSDAVPNAIISDGSGGERKYCGNTTFAVKPSNPAWRDMFLKLHVPTGYVGIKYSGMFCTALCNDNDKIDFEPLPKTYELKRDMRCVCGLQNKDDRLVGGQDASMNEFPWLVALVFPNTRVPFCGASVINDRFVLTASHCVEKIENSPEAVEVLYHAYNLDLNKNPSSLQLEEVNVESKTDEEEKTQRFKVSQIIRNPLYNEASFNYDVAILRLAQRIDLSNPDAPTPVCLPPSNETEVFSEKLIGETLTVAGWGLKKGGASETSSILQKLDVPFISTEECQHSLQSTITERMICTGNSNETITATCQGDSGGPLVFQQPNKQFVQVGIVSWGSRSCGGQGQASVYSKVSEFVPWIHYHSIEFDVKWCQDGK